MLKHLLVGTESYATILSMFPGGEIYDVSKFLYDVAHYKKGDKEKIVADLVALGIDGAAAFADEIIDAGKMAKRVAAKRVAAKRVAAKRAGKIVHKATSGVKLIPHPYITTTILGRYSDDMKFIIDDLILKDVNIDGLSPNIGGFNVLNITKEYDYTKFRDMYNKPFLDAALERGDVILLATKVSSSTIYINPALANPNVWENLTGFGREIYYLLNHGYKLASDGVTLIKR